MTVAEQDLQTFLELKQDRDFKEKVKKNHPNYVKALEVRLSIIEKMELARTEDERKSKKFMDWVYRKANSNYYHSGLINNAEVFLLKKNWELFIALKFCTPSPTTTGKFIDHKSVIEIDQIVSTKKGEAFKTMRSVIALGETLGCPITLWTETLENVRYFERYGFKNYGREGENNEHLMILDTTNF